jgi:murein DD-endopeptidase MepM/ murein hydrolase activator NlpD
LRWVTSPGFEIGRAPAGAGVSRVRRRLHGRGVQSAGDGPPIVQTARGRRSGPTANVALAPLLVSALLLTAALLPPGHTRESVPGMAYHPPIATRLPVSSSFGEFRRNHFHGGLDFSTEGRNGEPVFAVADGWVWRVRASGAGYGLALYVRLDDGRTAQYAHLERFAPHIAAFVEAAQESLDRYEIDLSPPPGRLPVRRGDTIAWSGESGAGPPHLHFEIREGETGDIGVNPRIFGFGDVDTTRPVIRRLIVTPVGAGSTVDGQPFRVVRTAVAAGPGRWTIRPPLDIVGRARLAVDALDPAPRGNRLAPYSVTLEVGAGDRSVSRLDRFDWNATHEVERHYDFAEADAGRSFAWVVARLLEPSAASDSAGAASPFSLRVEDHAGHGARLDGEFRIRAAAAPVVGAAPPAGLAPLPATGLRLRLDAAGLVLLAPPGAEPLCATIDPAPPRPPNLWERLSRRVPETRTLLREVPPGSGLLLDPPRRFVVRPLLVAHVGPPSAAPVARVRADTLDVVGLVRGGPEALRFGALVASFPESAAFEAAWIGLSEAPAETADGLAPVGGLVRLEAPGVVLDRAAHLALRPPAGADTSRVGLFRRGANGRWSFVGREADLAGALGGTTRYLGDFALFRDVAPPVVTPRAPLPGAVLKSRRPDIRVSIAEKGSGVNWRGMTATIDGVVQLLVYDPEARTLSGRSRRPLEPGPHRLSIVVVDAAGNRTQRDVDFRVAG